ncbi:MAG: DUF4080 domain-containing protein [Sulfuricella sp.]|nr:DUF4080 domain-containing protein [Sulfuricella sp.]
MPNIVITTLNARFSHASLGLRYLYANLGELRADTGLLEFVIGQPTAEIAEQILVAAPRIVGFGVYIWNVEEIHKIVALLKQVRPELLIVLGGPEVSHECDKQEIVQLADYVICGPGELAFPDLCQRLLGGQRPPQKVIAAAPVALADIELPYRHYSDADLAHRIIYVEASRGCPFKCEFCLSSLDKTVDPFDLSHFLAEMDDLYRRGLREFKFVDRTFNLNIQSCLRILDFFLERLDEKLFLHFELIPDHLPEKLKEAILRFPAGAIQFEVGVQTFNPEVQALISRRQDIEKTEKNLRWLREETHIHLHADLIIGLPGEDVASFAAGFNRLVALRPHDIQVGILKRLRGTTIIRHTQAYDLRFSPFAPYNILSTDRIDFPTMQRLARFARYWDMIANTGRFALALQLALDGDPFGNFLRLADWIYATTGKTHQINLDRLFDLVFRAMTEELGVAAATARAALAEDYGNCGARGNPGFLATAP